MPELIVTVIVLAILFDISNGYNDAANAIATVVSTRVLTPLQAVLLAAVMNVLGAFLTTAVAKTIGKGIVDPGAVTEVVVASALFAGFLWNTLMTFFGLPVSASHALIGGLIGAAVSFGGMEILNVSGLTKILSSLIISPAIGIVFGFISMSIVLKFWGGLPSSVINKYFGKLQIISASFMAFSHGSNDAQKVMGIITLALVSGGYLHTVEVPFWVILTCALAMGFGTAVGGWKVIKTLGVKMLKLEPIHGFAAETSATAVILGATKLGLPVSTTHVIATAIMGVGATKRLTAVRWGIGRKILNAWIFTLPACAIIAWITCTVLSLFI
ncbi:MAG: inorganic phosphate transporter [Nitrospirae bacterium]|jgi:inorganic phosphate transporter, PiT family|nr:inorganic phosphate transporter [Nitrospirota bacterium]